jgi:hypothetical protein
MNKIEIFVKKKPKIKCWLYKSDFKFDEMHNKIFLFYVQDLEEQNSGVKFTHLGNISEQIIKIIKISVNNKIIESILKL